MIAPDAIHTVDELGRQLRALRLAAPRPDPSADPLTLRELSAMTGVARSTLANAESGRILPRTEVVFRVALHCVADRADVPRWTDARRRVARLRAEARRGTGPSAPSARGDAIGPAVASATSERLQRMTVDDAVAVLQVLPPRAAAECLEAMRFDAGARHLHRMRPAEAAACVTEMRAGDAANCLDWVPPKAAAAILAHLDLAGSVALLGAMLPVKATGVVAVMPARTAVQRLVLLPADRAVRILQGLPTPGMAALLTTGGLPKTLIGEVLFGHSRPEAIALLEAMPRRHAAELLRTLPPDPAAGLLPGLRAETAVEVLAHLGTDDADVLLGRTPPAIAAEVRPGVDSSEIIYSTLAGHDATAARRWP
jgi:Mg/Co/Ni transporter MgtE